ncbi:MAG TPA: YkvA family protein [Pyrinomonadaceae bacterium]|nr:YkvA family protein [Pyrinomonadaceae bacterium]
MAKNKVKKIGKNNLRSRMKNLLMFLPNMVVLCAKLMVDSRVPRTERALFVGAVIYAIIPFDFIPDMIPFIGQVDDLFLIALTLLRLIDRTDDMIVREHWRGGGDIVALAESAATIAPLLMPKRVARVLLAKVKPTAEGTGLLANAAKFEPVLVETPESTDNPDRLRRLADVGSRKRRSKSA